jgi:gamma-glutamylputrescine oxidase
VESKKVIVATNGFARQLLPHLEVRPARAQVLITEPVKGLKLKGAFHYQQGYYYFRNIDGRVLLGGGRNLNFKGEETTQFGLTQQIQQKLETLLKTHILPGVPHKIDQRWSGIMGVGTEKKPIIKHISNNIVCAVRMGGMGIAIGSLVGEMAVKELTE